MKFLLIAFMCLIGQIANADVLADKNIIVLTEASPIKTNKGLLWLDETENMTVEQVLKRKNEFKSVSEILKSNNKIKSGTYWALSIFENNLTYDYFLKFVPFDTESSIYIVEEDEKIIPIKVQPYRKYNDFADINPESTQEIYSISKFTLAQIQKGKHTTILSKHTDYQPRANAFPIQYWDHVKFLEWSRFNLYFQGILLGIFIALSIFSFYYAYINKDSASFIYSLWLALTVIGILNTQSYGGDRLNEFFINFKYAQSINDFLDYFEIYIFYLLSYLFLIFGIISLNLKIIFPTIHKVLILLLAYTFLMDLFFLILELTGSDLIQLTIGYFLYIVNIPKLLTHSIFILTILTLIIRGFKLAIPLFLAALLHASVYLLPNLFSVEEVVNTLPSGLAFIHQLFHFICFAGQALIMACSIVARIRYMQDQLNSEANTHREFVENQNRVLEETVAERTQDLKLEAQKSERLMLNILPQSIATRLKAGDESISDSYKNATILFSDLVGFTKMSSGKTAEELVFLLNDLFKRFDTRATSLGLEKIKTIGDAYMVAGGLPTNDDEHAIRVTKMALGMYEDLDAFNKEHGMELDMRIGINSGPVVAGVIGHSKFSYDLWGNTVNTASRMESTCLPGKVQVSPSTYEQIKGHFDVQENQIIECKGLGKIMTYFVK